MKISKYIFLFLFQFFIISTICSSDIEDNDKTEFMEELNGGATCYNNLIGNFSEEEKSTFMHESPVEYYQNFIKNSKCDEDSREICIQGAVFITRSYIKQLCSGAETKEKVKAIKTKVSDEDFFNLLEIGENCYEKLGEFKTYVKSPVLNYNFCYKKCIENQDSVLVSKCIENCYHNSIINVFKVCEINDFNESDSIAAEGEL